MRQGRVGGAREAREGGLEGGREREGGAVWLVACERTVVCVLDGLPHHHLEAVEERARELLLLPAWPQGGGRQDIRAISLSAWLRPPTPIPSPPLSESRAAAVLSRCLPTHLWKKLSSSTVTVWCELDDVDSSPDSPGAGGWLPAFSPSPVESSCCSQTAMESESRQPRRLPRGGPSHQLWCMAS